MKKHFPDSIWHILIGMILIIKLQSCSTDKCSDVSCQNGGTCSDGSCNCSTGYEGSNCQTRASTKFQGSYIGSDDCDPYIDAVDIAGYSSTPSEISIDYFNNSSGEIELHLSGKVSGSSILIQPQNVVIGGTSVTYSGSGSLTGNTLYLQISENDNGNYTECNFTGNK